MTFAGMSRFTSSGTLPLPSRFGISTVLKFAGFPWGALRTVVLPIAHPLTIAATASSRKHIAPDLVVIISGLLWPQPV